MKDPQEDLLAVHSLLLCVCSGSALLGDLLRVSRSVKRDFLPVMSMYPGIFLSVFIVPLHGASSWLNTGSPT